MMMLENKLLMYLFCAGVLIASPALIAIFLLQLFSEWLTLRSARIAERK